MAKNGKMQKVVMGMLAVMFVTSLLLTVAMFAAPASALAAGGEPKPLASCWFEYRTLKGLCGGCGVEKAIYTEQRRQCCAWGCYAWYDTGQYCNYC